MIALRTWFKSFSSSTALALYLVFFASPLPDRAQAINITVDYRYDNGATPFFNTQQKKDALQAAANRYSAIITSSLSAVTLTDDSVDARIGFTHPSTGNVYRISPAASPATDAVKTMLGQSDADEYRALSIAADQWILYAGGRDMAAQGVGGQRGVVNFSSVFSTSGSVVNRNFRSAGSIMNLPVWGGSIAFDTNGTNWHFNHTTAAPNGTVDFYSLALHEIGHALGLNKDWLEWTSRLNGVQYSGQAVSAYNFDNGTTFATLNVEAPFPSLNPHWDEGAYDSLIFRNAGPNYVDTVGADVLQDLLMEVFLSSGQRFELTNVDVAALRDVGWSTVPQINVQPGDFNGSGTVDAADFILIAKGLTNGTYATWRANYGESLPASLAAESSHVPEPPLIAILAVAAVAIFASRRRNAYSRG